MTRSSSLLATQADAALALSHADSASRAELEHLIADVAAETLLLEVERLRVDRALESAQGPRIQRIDVKALRERRLLLDDELDELRRIAGRIRARLKGRG